MKKAELQIGQWALTTTEIYGPMKIVDLESRAAVLQQPLRNGYDVTHHIGYSAITETMTEAQAKEYIRKREGEYNERRKLQRMRDAAPEMLKALKVAEASLIRAGFIGPAETVTDAINLALGEKQPAER